MKKFQTKTSKSLQSKPPGYCLGAGWRRRLPLIRPALADAVAFDAGGARVRDDDQPRPLKRAARSHFSCLIRAVQLMVSAISILAVAGCDKFGVGGTGEVVVADHELHAADAARLDRFVIPGPPHTQPSTRPAVAAPMMFFTIEECRSAAIKNNLDLKVELYNPTISHTTVTQEQAAFEATFNAAANYSQNAFPAAGGVPTYTQYNVTPDVNLQIPLQTGGSIKIDAPFQYFQGTYVQQALNTYYSFTPNISISQPLLRGFGFDVNAQAIRIAFYQYQQVQARTKLEVIRVLADSDRAYWALYASRALLDVRRKQYDLAVAQQERARRQARAGLMAEVDIVRAESGVADQVEQIIIAENNVRQKERDLKRIMNRPDLGLETFTQLIPSTAPNSIEFQLDPTRLIAASMQQRMEMLDIELQIVADTAAIRYARNQTLPLLSVQYTYSHNGYSPQPEPTFNQVWSNKYDGHAVGLNLSIPIGNEAAKSQLRQAMLNRLQQLATRDQRAQQISQEVLNAVDTLSTDWQRILAAHKRVELAHRVLGVEIRQFNHGLRTSTEVLDAQAKLADAQSAEIAAITDYQVAQVDIAVATGTVLGASGVHFNAEGKDVERSIK